MGLNQVVTMANGGTRHAPMEVVDMMLGPPPFGPMRFNGCTASPDRPFGLEHMWVACWFHDYAYHTGDVSHFKADWLFGRNIFRIARRAGWPRWRAWLLAWPYQLGARVGHVFTRNHESPWPWFALMGAMCLVAWAVWS